MNRIFIPLFTLLILFKGYSQNGNKRCGIDFPTSVCESEESNGEITISWKKPIDPNGLFLKYDLYSLESPFVPIITFNNISNTSITIPNQYKKNNFFLVTSIICNGNEMKYYSDTSSLVNLTSVKFDEGIEQLNWNNNIKNKEEFIYIERKTELTQWKVLDSLNFKINSYFDTVDNCTKNLLYYRLGVKKNGCIGYSKIVSDSLQDKYQPRIPKIVSVGFDTLKQNLVISWKKTKEKDIQGYIIYQEINGLSNPLDTVLNNNNSIDTFYTIYNPSIKMINNYRIAAFDFCYSNPPKFQTSAQSQNFYTTIVNYEYDVCSNEVKLQWNKNTTTDDLKYYKVYLKKFNNWKCIDSLNNTNYTLKLEKFTTNIITIETVTQSGFKFFSNRCNIYSRAPSKPNLSYTNYASITDDFVEIKHTLNPTTGLKQLALFKLTDQNEFTEIQRVDANKSEVIFIDTEVNTAHFSYEYFIQQIDSCNNFTKKNIIQKTILLKENSINEDSISTSVMFNNYNGFLGGINKYEIYKSTDNFNYEKIADFYSDSTTIFNYKIENKEAFEGKICFKVKSIENKNYIGKQSFSYSNPICLYFQPKIYIPNSFTPNGLNPIFKPIISIAKIESIELIIFNRWGQTIFSSTENNLGWNGKNGSEEAPNGLYIYQLKINQGSDKEILKRGLINLIR